MARTATVDRPAPPVEMGRIEAEAVTQAIKDNFDSLGAMLIQARDRKAYKALGYRTFEGYCKTEFGKSSSNAYRLIEDAKVVAQLEAEISKRYEEPVSLNIPSACLRPLKELPDIGEKLKAIDYAKKLATAEGEKATKKHLEIAVFQINGHRSDDFRSAIESLGFKKGVQVEVTKNLKKDRGFVTKVDRKGKIYIQLYNDGVTSLPYDATDLRILNNTEKPTISASDNTTNKGDKVRIFAKGLEGKTGEIYTWKMGRHALVMVESESAPVSISYAELELIQDEDIEAITVETIENKPPQWEENLSWTSGENHYYYFARENKIYNTSWPNNITITPDTHSKNPVKFIEDWMHRFAGSVAKSLVSDTEILLENQRLREQLVEAESVIKTMVKAASIASSLDSVKTTDFLVKNAAEISTASGLESTKIFDENYRNHDERMKYGRELVEETTELTKEYWEHYPKISTPGDTTEAQGGTDFAKSEQTAEFLVEDAASTVSALASAGSTDFLVENIAEISAPEDTTAQEVQPELPSKIIERIATEREIALSRIEDYEKRKEGKLKEKEIQNIDGNIGALRRKLETLERYEQLRIGQTVYHERRPMILGKVSSLDFSQGGMPCICVNYFKDGELEKTSVSENGQNIFALDL